MRRKNSILCLGLAGLLASSGGAVAETSEAVLDGSGRVYQVQTGTYGELFPGSVGEAGDPVLALDVRGPGQEVQRLLVEGSSGPAVESAARLVYEDATQALYILWESRESTGDLSVRLVSLRNTRWSEVIEVSTGFPLVAPPRMVVTRDSYVTLDSGGVRHETARTTLHLAWIEESSAGAAGERVIYAPAILEDGEYLGSAPTVILNDLDPSQDVEPHGGSEPLSASLALEPGVDSRAVIATFLNPENGRVVTTEIRMIPGELADAALNISRRIVEEGGQTLPPGDLDAFAGGVGGMVIDIGWALHDSLRHYLAVQVEIAIQDGSFESDGPGIVLQSLADGVGGMVIDIGSRVILSGGLERDFLPERRSLLRIPRQQAGGEGESAPLHEAEPFHLIHFYVVSDRPAPAISVGAMTFLSSESGEHGLVCWENGDGQLQYQETSGSQGWTETQTLTLGDHLSLEQAEAMLRKRVRRR